jgi:uncharacterized OB-fold protein
VPEDLVRAAEAHGKAVAAADNQAVLADFLPDRIGQLIASADVPTRLESSQVRSITDVGGGRYDVIIRYTKPDHEWFELRSRWLRYTDGSWRVRSVRNIPDTPPWMDLTGPTQDGLDGPHWDALRAGRLELQRCRDCRRWTWSPRPICPKCHSFDMGWQEVEPVGHIFSWTRTWQPFTPEATGHLPYVLVLVELPHADRCRVIGVLEHADGVTPAIGATVFGAVVAAPDDRHWPLVRWRLDVSP